MFGKNRSFASALVAALGFSHAANQPVGDGLFSKSKSYYRKRNNKSSNAAQLKRAATKHRNIRARSAK